MMIMMIIRSSYLVEIRLSIYMLKIIIIIRIVPIFYYGAHKIMVIVFGNELGDRVQILDKTFNVSLRTNSLEKNMNLSVLTEFSVSIEADWVL